MKNDNLSSDERLQLLVAELEKAEAAKSKSDKKILSLKQHLSDERKSNKELSANVGLIKERIKNAENAELREYLDKNGVLISDVFAAVKGGKIPKSAPEQSESTDNLKVDIPAESEKSVTGDTSKEETNV